MFVHLREGNKIRLLLWNGVKEYTVPSPDKFSIVRVSDTDRPANLMVHNVKEVGEKKTFALVLYLYTMVKEGALVKWRLGGNASQANGHSQFGATLSPQPRSTPPTVSSTPSLRPPPSKVAPSPTNLSRQNVKRNLDSTFDAPAPKRSLPIDSNPTYQVADVNPYLNRYKLKVRVDNKSPVKKLQTQRFTGSVQDCLISDQSGSIKVNVWDSNGREDTSHLDKLEVGSTYMMEGLQVMPVHNPRYNTTGHNYELTWCQNTVTSGPVTDCPVRQSYKFVPISSLEDTEAGTVADLVAWVREEGDLIQFRSKAEKDLKKREIVLADNSKGGSSVNLVLWAEQAEQFSCHDAIIAIKGAKLAEYNGTKNISLRFGHGTLRLLQSYQRWRSGPGG